jgi:hypothetical protein
MNPEQKIEITQLLEGQEYRIDLITAYPQNTTATNQLVNDIMLPTGNSSARIDITGDGNFLTINGDLGTADMPFFGERRTGASYNTSNVGIKFNDEIRDYTVTEYKGTLRAKFSVRGEDDQYTITLTVYGNKSVTVFVSCSNKTNMQYDGTLIAIPVEEE